MPLSRTNAPTAGRPGNRVFSSSFPSTITFRRLRAVQFIQPASFLEGKVTDLVQLRLDAQDFSAGVGEFADLDAGRCGK